MTSRILLAVSWVCFGCHSKHEAPHQAATPTCNSAPVAPPAVSAPVTARIDGFAQGPLEITLPAGSDDHFKMDSFDADDASIGIDSANGWFEVTPSKPRSLARAKQAWAKGSKIKLE